MRSASACHSAALRTVVNKVADYQSAPGGPRAPKTAMSTSLSGDCNTTRCRTEVGQRDASSVERDCGLQVGACALVRFPVCGGCGLMAAKRAWWLCAQRGWTMCDDASLSSGVRQSPASVSCADSAT